MRHNYSDKELDDLKRRFPNVNEDEFRVVADDILKDQMNIWVTEADWDEPEPGDVERLRGLLRSKDLEVVADHCWDDDYEKFKSRLEEFVDSDDVSPEYLEENGEFITKMGEFFAGNPLCGDDFLSLDHTHTISAVMSFGGPGSSIDFTLDKDGELIGAEAVYSWGFKSHKIRLDDETAEKLWSNFSYISDSIRYKEDQYFRSGPRM